LLEIALAAPSHSDMVQQQAPTGDGSKDPQISIVGNSLKVQQTAQSQFEKLIKRQQEARTDPKPFSIHPDSLLQLPSFLKPPPMGISSQGNAASLKFKEDMKNKVHQCFMDKTEAQWYGEEMSIHNPGLSKEERSFTNFNLTAVTTVFDADLEETRHQLVLPPEPVNSGGYCRLSASQAREWRQINDNIGHQCVIRKNNRIIRHAMVGFTDVIASSSMSEEHKAFLHKQLNTTWSALSTQMEHLETTVLRLRDSRQFLFRLGLPEQVAKVVTLTRPTVANNTDVESLTRRYEAAQYEKYLKAKEDMPSPAKKKSKKRTRGRGGNGGGDKRRQGQGWANDSQEEDYNEYPPSPPRQKSPFPGRQSGSGSGHQGQQLSKKHKSRHPQMQVTIKNEPVSHANGYQGKNYDRDFAERRYKQRHQNQGQRR
jgi:hypothetical protein